MLRASGHRRSRAARRSALHGRARRIEEVIVTAERREASIQGTSISITAFTGEFMGDFGIRNQEDLQNYLPATTIQPYDATVRAVGRNFRSLAGRLTYAHRERDGIVDNIGQGPDIDGLGTDNLAIQLKWNITDTLSMKLRQNWMDIDRSMGGADGAGLVVLNEGASNPSTRETGALVPGWRRVDPDNTNPANFFQNDFNGGSEAKEFIDPSSGQTVLARRNRAGIDFGDFSGLINAAASSVWS